MGRDEGKTAIHSRAGRFLKVTALFLYFLCSRSFGRLFLHLFINKKVFSMEQKVILCLLWRSSRFACMVFAREDSRESNVDYFDSFFSELWFEGW